MGVPNGTGLRPDVGRLFAAAEADFARYEVVKDLVDEFIDLSLNYRQSGHPGGSRSKVHMLLALLLSGAMRWDIRRPWRRFADRLRPVRGPHGPPRLRHARRAERGAAARYALTGTTAFAFPDDGRWALTWEELLGLRHRGGLPGHAEMAGQTLFLKFNTGPSGHGMPPAAGEALALKLAGAGEVKVFVVEGEGGLTPGAAPRDQEHRLGAGPVQPGLPGRLERLRHRPAAGLRVVPGTPVDWFAPYGWRVTGTEHGHGVGAGDPGRAGGGARPGPDPASRRGLVRPARAAATASTTPPATARPGR